MFFFLLWPLFARAPRRWFLEIFLLSAPGVQSVFFCCAPLGAATFRRGQSKKKTPPRMFFFFAPAPGKGRGRRSHVPARGQSKKKKTPPRVCFFPAAPAKGKGRRSSVGRRHGARAKKTPWVVFFFFLLWPRAGAQRGFSFPCLSPGPQQKKTPWVVLFFFFSGPVPARGFSFPCLSPGPEHKKKHPGWCFFFCCGPARTLTHSLRAWVAMPPPRQGGAFFFCCGPARTGVVFFFCLLWPRWPRAGAQRGFSFPCLSPGPEQKKNTLGGVFFFALASCRRPTGLLLPLPFAGAAAKKNTLDGFFFALAPCRHGASPSPAFPRGRSKKKKHPGWCCFFCCGPARTLTHSLRAWVAMPPPRRGGVFFFCCGPARTGMVFFFAVAPPGRSLTHCGLGRFRQGPGGVFFFCCGPAGSF